MPRALLLWLVAAAVVATAACHNQTRKTLVPDVPRSVDPHALARFDEARQKFLRYGSDACSGTGSTTVGGPVP